MKRVAALLISIVSFFVLNAAAHASAPQSSLPSFLSESSLQAKPTAKELRDLKRIYNRALSISEEHGGCFVDESYSVQNLHQDLQEQTGLQIKIANRSYIQSAKDFLHLKDGTIWMFDENISCETFGVSQKLTDNSVVLLYADEVSTWEYKFYINWRKDRRISKAFDRAEAAFNALLRGTASKEVCFVDHSLSFKQAAQRIVKREPQIKKAFVVSSIHALKDKRPYHNQVALIRNASSCNDVTMVVGIKGDKEQAVLLEGKQNQISRTVYTQTFDLPPRPDLPF